MTAAQAPLVCVEDLKVSFTVDGQPVHAVTAASFTIDAGQSVAIVGESGSGKSTLARALIGLLPGGAGTSVSGKLVVEGQELEWSELAKHRGRTFAMVFQDPLSFLDPLMKVGNQIGEAVRLHDRGTDSRARVAELLDLVKLPARNIAAYPHELSGGMRQRALLAVALACRPKLLIADEPTTALDVTTQKEILDLIKDVQNKLGMALLLISHDLAIVSALCRHVYVMYRGAIIEGGELQRVFGAPSHEYSRQLLEAARKLSAGSSASQTPAASAAPTLPPPSSGTPILEIEGVSKSFALRSGGTFQALKNVSVAVAAGETLAIVGELGSGKSTLARIALALLAPDGGDVRLCGNSLIKGTAEQVRTWRTAMHPVFQDLGAAFNPRRTVAQILRQALAVRAVPPGQHRQAAMEVLEQVKLDSRAAFLNRFPHELSGGQRQRLAIARALATQPALIVADEPLSGADLSIRARIVELLADLQRQRGIAYLFITHDIWLARAFAHRVAVMNRGEIVEQGPAESLIARPQHPYTRKLIDSVPEMVA